MERGAIRLAVAGEQAEVAALLGEYLAELPAGVCQLETDTELADPLAFYECVLLTAGGLVALRRVDAATAEVKRLYVRPDGRGTGLGRLLIERLIAEARSRGYRELRLDTLPSMRAAQVLYDSLGFQETAPFGNPPTPGGRFLSLVLAPHR